MYFSCDPISSLCSRASQASSEPATGRQEQLVHVKRWFCGWVLVMFISCMACHHVPVLKVWFYGPETFSLQAHARLSRQNQPRTERMPLFLWWSWRVSAWVLQELSCNRPCFVVVLSEQCEQQCVHQPLYIFALCRICAWDSLWFFSPLSDTVGCCMA